MIAADLVRLLAQLFPAVTFVFGVGHLWHLALSAAVYGAATAYFIPGAAGLIPSLVPVESLQKANAWLGAAADTGKLIGPGLASVIIYSAGVPWALGFDALTFVVSLFSLVWVARNERGCASRRDTRENSPKRGRESAEVRFREAVKLMPQLPMILAAILLWVPVQVGTAAVGVLGPLIAQERFGGVEQWGIMAMGLAAGGLIGAAVSSRVSTNRRGLLTLALIVVSAVTQLLGLAFAPNAKVATALFFCGALAASVAGITFDTLVQLSTPPEMLSRVSSFEQTMTTALVPVGVAIALPLATLMGTSEYLMTLLVVVVLVGVVVTGWAWSRSGPNDVIAAAISKENATHDR